MRFHLVALPHTQTTEDFPACAFTNKVIRFAKMMMSLGHEVFLYSGDENTTPCTEQVSCIKENERLTMLDGVSHYVYVDWDHAMAKAFTQRVIGEISRRIQPQDFICLTGGYAQKPIADAFPNNLSVEYGIGYPAAFSEYRVYESYAWMHSVIVDQTESAYASDGRFYDTVIPNQIEDDLYELGDGSGGYALYVGRLIARKGFNIAQTVCKELGMPLKLAGPGDNEFVKYNEDGTLDENWEGNYGEFLGEVDAKTRAELMQNAACVFVPTIYIEPFGTVAIEAMACGTPVISTDWGAMTETIINGFNGYRCRLKRDFKQAVIDVQKLDRAAIRKHAYEKYSMKTVAKQYEKYFEDLLTLYGKGWYED